MDSSALEREINNLEIRSDSLDAWLLFWIILVVAGLVVEVCVVIKEHRGKTEKRTVWTLLLELIGPVLITVGVAGELGIHVMAGHVDTALRNANKKVFALLNKEAADAQKGAAEAVKKAKEAEERARKFEASISSANALAEQAKQVAERERLERVKLEAQVAPRLLSVERQRAITASLKRFKGRNVAIVTYSLDVEAAVLASQIIPTSGTAYVDSQRKRPCYKQPGQFFFNKNARLS